MSNLEELQRHTLRKFNRELQELHQRVLQMGEIARIQVLKSLGALTLQDAELGENVIADDNKINELEIGIDQACLNLIARHQPVASDLRLVLAMLKTINDLERIGDEALRIAGMAVHLAKNNGSTVRMIDFSALGEHVGAVLQRALDAFARMDMHAALAVAQEDVHIDQECHCVVQQVMAQMQRDPVSVPLLMDIMWSLRALERISDRAQNICEYVVYYVSGENIRHKKLLRDG
jgi:phosphate transport system protein